MAPKKREDDDDAPEVTTTDAGEDVENTSSDAAHSTYHRVDTQREGEVNPPPGPQSQQKRGVPQEASD